MFRFSGKYHGKCLPSLEPLCKVSALPVKAYRRTFNFLEAIFFQKYRYHIFRADNYTDVMSISKEHDYKSFTRSPPASLLHCIENIFNHSFGKCRDSVTMAALSFIKSTGLRTIFIY